jgi:hypothetical protein
MKVILLLIVHFFLTAAKLLGPDCAKSVMAETLLMKHQLIVTNRSRKRSPNLTAIDRLVLGLCTLFINVRRIPKLAVVLQPSRMVQKLKRTKNIVITVDYV